MVPTHMILIALAGLQLLVQWAFSTSDLARRDSFKQALPWIFSGAVVLKLLLAGLVLRIGLRRGVLERGTAARLFGTWFLAAVLLFAFLAWLVPSTLVSRFWLAVGVVLFLPLMRPSVAPLALSWNRHR
jgi:hypothetical protein